MSQKLLEAKNLTTHFFTQDGVVQAVNDVSFDVEAGETVALVGESGCGKTVSVLSIMRLIASPPGKIISGEVFFDGMDLLKLSDEEMRRIRGSKIAMIFQEPLTSLNPVLTIGRQITEVLEQHRGLTPVQAHTEAINLLKLVGIPRPERRINDYAHHFSGGMRQRVMIAMAISCSPQLLIADEPTTTVDVTIQAQLLELIKNLTRKYNTALILITHNLGIVARYAQRVYVMYAGRVIEHGPASEIYHHPCHAYTAGLLSSVPRLDEPRKIRLAPIEGQPPDMISPPTGCPFKPRCRFACDECNNKDKLIEVDKGHFSSCTIARTDKS